MDTLWKACFPLGVEPLRSALGPSTSAEAENDIDIVFRKQYIAIFNIYKYIFNIHIYIYIYRCKI